jgi:hypothetical protein
MPTMDLGQFAKEFGAVVAEAAKEIASETRDGMARFALPRARAIAPVGGALSKDKNPGRLKRSIRLVPSTRPEDPAMVVSEGTDAPHASIIDRGRRRGVTPTGQKRVRAKKGEKLKPNKQAKMLGSKQAPAGIKRPVVAATMKEAEAIATRAIAKAEGKLR